MKVIIDAKEETRQVDYVEKNYTPWIGEPQGPPRKVPILFEGERAVWTIGRNGPIPVIVKDGMIQNDS